MTKEMTPEERAEYETLMRQAQDLQKTFDMMIGNAFGSPPSEEETQEQAAQPQASHPSNLSIETAESQGPSLRNAQTSRRCHAVFPAQHDHSRQRAAHSPH